MRQDTRDIATMTDEEFDLYWGSEECWEDGWRELEERKAGPKDEEPIWTLMSYEEAHDAWGPNAFPTGDYAAPYISTKSIWDNYRNPKGMGPYESIIFELERVFPDVESAHRKRPLGEFKELLELTHEEVYDVLCSRMIEKHEAKDGRSLSFIEAAWPHARELFREHMTGRDRLTERQFYQGISLMLYGSSIGIYLEGLTSRLIQAQLEGSKLGKRFSYEEAPYTLEREDVDGIIVDKETGKTAAHISVKTMGALTEGTVDRYRNGKNKTLPDIYLGVKSLQDARDGKLSSIKVDGKSLAMILKDSIARS